MPTLSRRNFLHASLASGASLAQGAPIAAPAATQSDRNYWVSVLARIAQPVLSALSERKLKLLMPVEAPHGNAAERRQYTYLEALGRLLAGIAPARIE